MASPFAVFRKHQKMLLATIGLMAMIAFVFLSGPILDTILSGSAQNPVVVRTAKYGNLDQRELYSLIQRRQLVITFLQRALSQSYNNPIPIEFIEQTIGSATEESVVDTWLLANRAEEMGLVITDHAVNAFIREETDDRISAEQLKQIVERMGTTQRQIFAALRDELAARQVMMIFSSSLPGTPPGLRWQYYERLNRRATIEAAPVPVARFVGEVADPDQATLREFFDKYKDDYSVPNSPDPGFRLPQRAMFEYLKADYESFLDPAAVSEEEARQFYEQYKDVHYVKTELPEVDDSGEPEGPAMQAPDAESQPAEEPEAGDSKPEKKPEAEKPKAEEPKPEAEKPKAEEPKPEAEEPKAEEPKAEKKPEAKAPPAEKPPAQETEPKEPSTEQPSSDQPSAEESTSNNAKPEAPKAEKPVAEESKAEKPAAQKPNPDTPQPEASESSRWGSGAFRLVSMRQDSEETAGTPPGESEESPKSDPAGDAQPEPKPEASAPLEQQGEPKTPASEPSAATDAETETSASDDQVPDTASGGAEEASKPVEYEPYEEVEESIRRRLAREQAATRIDDIFQDFRDQMRSYHDEWIRYEVDVQSQPDLQPPKRPDFSEWAANYEGLTAHETDLVSALEAAQLDIGDSRIRGVTEFTAYAFDTLPLFRPEESQDDDGNRYLFWKTEQVDERIPEFDEEGVRARVLREWKMIQARGLAVRAAKELAEEARKANQTLEAAIGQKPGVAVVETSPFSWLTVPAVPNQFMSQAQPEISKIEGVDAPGHEFMETVFDLEPGQIGVALNRPKTAAYVVRVVEKSPSDRVLWDLFLVDDYSKYASVAFEQQAQLMRNWRAELRRRAGLQWEREPDRP